MEANPYESAELLGQYLVFHYAPEKLQFPYDLAARDAAGFPKKCVSAGLDLAKIGDKERALDLGCSVGRSTFELARHFTEVIGIDYSEAFVDAANLLKQDGRRPATLHEEGERVRRIEVEVDSSIERDRVSFERGDAQELRPDLGSFNAVIACNLICRLADPKALLEHLPSLVKPGGQLFLTTPFTWLEEYTPRENWLGEGEQNSFDALQTELEPSFSLDERFDLPFLIREHARKFQYGVALGSRWIRR
jgi:putative 4-mercaptohistidine N1-methyltranferase